MSKWDVWKAFWFDAANNMLALTDSVGNTTYWSFDHLNRPIAETNELGDTRSTFYDEVGNVVKVVDRNERVREFSFDPLYRQTEERWKDGANTVRTISSLYNDADELIEIEDQDTGGTLSKLAFTHDALGRVTVVDNDGTADVPNVVLTSGYNTLSRRTSLAAEIDSTDDFLNTWTYDDLGRMTRVDQAGQMGGNTVAEKRVDFDYNLAGQFTQIVRYKDIDGGSGNEVATSAFTYDPDIGLLTDLVHTHDTTAIATYEWTYDEINRVDTFTWDDDSVTYGYNANSELTAADYTTQTDESYSFDLAGNRTGGSYDTGDNNQLLDDGTFTYTYDDEGNRLTRTRKSSDPANDYTTEYTWDYRGRLTRVAFRNNSGTLTKAVEFKYDVFDDRIAKLVDSDGDTDFDTEQHYAYDGDQIALVFDAAGSLTNRILSGPAVDQVLADENLLEQVTAAARVRWPLPDNLGTGRDIVDNDGDVLNHISYDSFGKRIAETNAAVDLIFGWTAREFDEETGLQYNRARYYDPAVGRWISEDPIGFDGGDTNLNRYVGNDPTDATDPSGEAQHRKNKRRLNRDKHTRRRPGRPTTKQRGHRGWNDRTTGDTVKTVGLAFGVAVGIGVVVGTIAEDIATGGLGIADDPATLAFGVALIVAPFVTMDDAQASEPDGGERVVAQAPSPNGGWYDPDNLLLWAHSPTDGHDDVFVTVDEFDRLTAMAMAEWT